MTTVGHFTLASVAGTMSASSRPFHLSKNLSSPSASVAPMMRSGSRPRLNPFFELAPLVVVDEVVLLIVDRRDFLFDVDFGVTDFACSSVIFGLKDRGVGFSSISVESK